MEEVSPRQSLKTRVLNLWKSHSSPHEIALGIAVGVFIGVTPFYGLHLIMAFIVALVLKRVNKVALFLAVNISLPPTIPFITWAGYEIGRSILGSAYPPLGWNDFLHFSHETFFKFFYALLIGSFILGIGLSSLSYFVSLWFLKKRKVKNAIVTEIG
jgi:uncharacterized protein (DUF2062 family)